jgi:hypothetical protein
MNATITKPSKPSKQESNVNNSPFVPSADKPALRPSGSDPNNSHLLPDPKPPTPPADERDSVLDRVRNSAVREIEAMQPEQRNERHKTRVGTMASIYGQSATEQGLRNMAIGEQFILDCWEQSASIPEYTASDTDRHAGQVRDEIRMYLPIKPDSIKPMVWAKAWMQQQLLVDLIGNDTVDSEGKPASTATLITFHEHVALIGNSLVFDKKTLDARLVLGWIDTLKALVALHVKNNGPVKRETLEDMIKKNEARLAAEAEASNPTEHARLVLAAADKEKERKTAKRKAAVQDSVRDALAAGSLDADNIMAIVETTAKNLPGVTAPSMLGANPATIDKREINQFVQVMVSAGRLTEMRYFRKVLSKAIEQAEAATSAAVTSADGSTQSQQTRLATEQKRVESQRNRPEAPIPTGSGKSDPIAPFVPSVTSSKPGEVKAVA